MTDPNIAADAPPDWTALRARFPSTAHLAYLNSGSCGLLADSVRAAFGAYLDSRLEKGADWAGWLEEGEALRSAIARLLNAAPAEIAITASASAGLNALASALDYGGVRNGILLSPFEFPTSGQIWAAQGRRGARLAYGREMPDHRLDVDHFVSLIDDRTAVVAMSQVCYRHGARIGDDAIRRVVEVAHRHGAAVVLDCYQAVGAVDIDLARLGVDYAVGGMLKYLLGTAGVGFLYARAARDDIPVDTGWFAQADIGAMDMHRNAPSADARRFQAGTPPVPSCYASRAGVDLVLAIGTRAIEARIASLRDAAAARLADAGARLATPLAGARGPMLAVKANNADALVAALGERQVIVSARDGNIRAGFHFYNDTADMDRLMAALADKPELWRAAQ